jgi:hypothetical protein
MCFPQIDPHQEAIRAESNHPTQSRLPMNAQERSRVHNPQTSCKSHGKDSHEHHFPETILAMGKYVTRKIIQQRVPQFSSAPKLV